MTIIDLETVCPYCGRVNDQHTGRIRTAVPADGDVSICYGCLSLAVFVSGPLGIYLRMPTPEEAFEMSTDPRVVYARAAIRNVR